MTQIKSEKAKERIEYYSDDTDFIYPLTKEQIVEVVAIAEQEADERHAKQLQELKDKLDCDKYHLEANHQIEMNEVWNKCFSDIKEFTAKWEASDRKMDALHIKEINELKDYIESIHAITDDADHLCEVKRFIELNKFRFENQ